MTVLLLQLLRIDLLSLGFQCFISCFVAIIMKGPFVVAVGESALRERGIRGYHTRTLRVIR